MSAATSTLRPSEAAGHWLVLALCAAALLAAQPQHAPLNNPNEGVRVFAVKALVEDGTFAIDDVVREWGYIDDKATRDGHLYSSKAPLPQLLGAAGYAVVHAVTGDLPRRELTFVARFFGGALPALLVLLAFALLLRRRLNDAVVADLVVVGVALGSGFVAGLTSFSGHALAALAPATALLASLPAADEARSTTLRRSALCGLLLAAAVGCEYPAVLTVVPVGVLALWRGLRAGRVVSTALGLALGAAPVVVAVSVAHAAMFGAPWRTGYSMLENKGYEALVTATPLFGIGAPDPLRLATALFSPSVGLFFFCPLLLLGLVAAMHQALRAQQAARADAVVVVAGVALMALFIAGYGGWRGGWSVGPRYLCELTGLLALAAARFADERKHRAVGRVVVAIAVGAGLVASGLPGLMFPHLPDALSNPIAQLVVPLAVRGFAPDGVALWVLGSPRAASFVLLVSLWLPLLVVVVRGRTPGVLPAAAIGASAFIGLCALVPVAPARAGPEALEARRMFDNWRPWRGNPYVAPALGPGAEDDKAVSERLTPRVALAIDRARVALPRLAREGCAPAPDVVTVPAADGSGASAALAQALAHGVIAADALVVVDDALALAIGPAHARPNMPVIATRSDVARFAKAALPCAGLVWVVSTTDTPPRGAGAVVHGPLALEDGYTLVGRAR